jgi:uncharacterized protein (DUF1697 family)
MGRQPAPGIAPVHASDGMVSMTSCVALIRGINVGRAKRIAMADLRDLAARLGHGNVRTVLNSGNVLFDTNGRDTRAAARVIEAGIESRFGFAAAVIVVTASELDAIVRSNPLPDAVADPARFLVAFVQDAGVLAPAKPLVRETWTPERLAIGSAAAYLHLPGGSAESPLLKAFTRATRESATTRNWSTVLKLMAAACQGEES